MFLFCASIAISQVFKVDGENQKIPDFFDKGKRRGKDFLGEKICRGKYFFAKRCEEARTFLKRAERFPTAIPYAHNFWSLLYYFYSYLDQQKSNWNRNREDQLSLAYHYYY